MPGHDTSQASKQAEVLGFGSSEFACTRGCQPSAEEEKAKYVEGLKCIGSGVQVMFRFA